VRSVRDAGVWLLSAALLISCGRETRTERPIVVGSKNFTESVLLGELLAQQLEAGGCRVDRRLNMGGTFVCDAALSSGSLDAYVEYSGTALTAILKKPLDRDPRRVSSEVESAYRDRGLSWGPALGFNNTFAMIVRKKDAEALGLRSIGDLRKVQDRFQPGFGYEFTERPDGWSGLLGHYGLSFAARPRTMDLGLTYRALASGNVDLIAGNSTDGLIESLGLMILEDDRRYFPPYDAAVARRQDVAAKCAAAETALAALAGSIDDARMRALNLEVDGKKRDVAEVVREFLARRDPSGTGTP